MSSPFLYPTATSGSIRQISLSPFNENSPASAYGLALDESNRVTITKCSKTNSSLEMCKSFPLAGSPRAAVWCPFVTNATPTDYYCLVTSCVGCPVQLRYFSEKKDNAGEGDDEDQSHDPAWVEGTYKCYDDLDYLISANTICWHKSRKGQLVCGFDKGYLGIFDVERPGRDLSWRQQVNSLCAFQNNTSHNRKITNPQHAVSAIAVHETAPDLIACGTRCGFMPIFDSRMKLPACVLKCDNNNEFGHAVNSAITEIQFDPNSQHFVYSTSRGKGKRNNNNNLYQSGIVQHDLRKPQFASGFLMTREVSSNNNKNEDNYVSEGNASSSSTMQPIHFNLANASDSKRILEKFGQQKQQQEDSADENSATSSFIISGNPSGSDPILGYCSKNNNSNQQQLRANTTSSASIPLTAVSVCTQRGIMLLGGGQRNFAEPDEDGEDLGPMEVGKIRGRDLPHQISSAFGKVVKF